MQPHVSHVELEQALDAELVRHISYETELQQVIQVLNVRLAEQSSQQTQEILDLR